MKRISYNDLQFGPVLGTGTVGTIYQATIKPTGQQIAVKILQPAISGDALVRARFRREMEILERMSHPHIIRYFGGGELDGQLYYGMELLEAGNVRDMLERYGRLTWKEVASIGRQVCSALQYAHNQGIIHRDLKPGNLFLDSEANVKLGDFGIARDTNSADITSQGLTVGTHAYMAPEQITGEDSITGKADLYALGCVLFELLTGAKPFQGPNFAVLFEQHLRKPAPRVEEFVSDCPGALADVVGQLLSKSPDDRPFNARSVQGVLNELLDDSSTQPGGEQVAGTGNADVGAAAVYDCGQLSLARRLQPANRPDVTWKTVAILAAVVAGLVILGVLAGQQA